MNETNTDYFSSRYFSSPNSKKETDVRIEQMTFADRLRHLAKQGQYGHSREPHNYYPRDNDMGYCPWEWMNRELYKEPLKLHDGRVYAYRIASEKTSFDFNVWKKFCEFSRRYRRFHAYLTEILPEWKKTNTFYYADNSVVVEETDKNGNKRERYEVMPHGDLCY